MKRATLIMAVLLALPVRAGDKKVDVSKIHGRIQFVQSFPDYKVQAVTSFPDLRVQIVKSFPDSPGKVTTNNPRIRSRSFGLSGENVGGTVWGVFPILKAFLPPSNRDRRKILRL
jgi:hypothetical protein